MKFVAFHSLPRNVRQSFSTCPSLPSNCVGDELLFLASSSRAPGTAFLSEPDQYLRGTSGGNRYLALIDPKSSFLCSAKETTSLEAVGTFHRCTTQGSVQGCVAVTSQGSLHWTSRVAKTFESLKDYAKTSCSKIEWLTGSRSNGYQCLETIKEI